MTLVGLGFGKFFVYDIYELGRKAQPLSLHYKGIFFAGLFTPLGLTLTLFGEKLGLDRAKHSKMTSKNVLVAAIVLAPGIGLCVWLHWQLAQWGYEF